MVRLIAKGLSQQPEVHLLNRHLAPRPLDPQSMTGKACVTQRLLCVLEFLIAGVEVMQGTLCGQVFLALKVICAHQKGPPIRRTATERNGSAGRRA